MNTANRSILSLQHSNHQCDVHSYKDGKRLKSLWLSIPAYCHLKCPYCFASTNEPGKKIESLSFNQYEHIINEFAELGGEFIGIPGDGEPFHESNWDLTKLIIELCHKLKIKLALFTTGDLLFINNKGNDEDNDYSKIEYIKDKDVVLLVKYNHSDEKIQNELVGRLKYNYARLRENALNILINKYHFNDERQKLGLVTSIMIENSTVRDDDGKIEIVKIFERTRRDKLIFDCDTILELGRGKVFSNPQNVPPKIDLADVFKKLTEAGAVGINQGGTYVGNTCCDRILHHLYIKSNGDTFPCIGCSRDDYTGDDNINRLLIGNIKEKSLSDLWNNSKLRRRLAEDRYNIISGICYSCENFQSELCYSCLGRCINSDRNKFLFDEEGNIKAINTEGCIHHKPSTAVWLAETIDYIRKALSYPETIKIIKEKGLEYLWRPNKNLAYTLWQLKENERIPEIRAIIEHIGNPHDGEAFKPYSGIKDSDVQMFSQKKHYQFSELRFPMNTVWDFIHDPELLKNNDPGINENQEKFVNIISQSFLSNIFLASFKILYGKHDSEEKNIKYTNFILYDNIKERYFYRSILSDQNFTENRFVDNGIGIYSLIISRWYENIKYRGQEKNLWTEYCHNLSADFRHEIYGDYELQLSRSSSSRTELKERTIDISRILDLKELGIKNKVASFTKYIDANKNNLDLKKLNSKIFKEFEEYDQDIEAIVDFYSNLNQNVFFSLNDDQNQVIIDKIEKEIEIITEVSSLKSHISEKLKEEYQNAKRYKRASKVLNYLVYLGIMREVLKVNYYYLLHSINFASINPRAHELLANPSIKRIIKASGVLICTVEPINRDFRSELKLFVSSIFAPFDEFYFKMLYADAQVVKEFNKKVKSHRHSILNIRNAFINVLMDLSHVSSKCLNQSCNNKDQIRLEVSNLETVYEVYNVAVLSGITERSEMPSYFGRYISDLIKIICKYCEITYTKLEPQYNNSIGSYEDAPSSIEAFTILFNLITNAAESDAYRTWNNGNFYNIKYEKRGNEYCVIIENPAVINKKCIDFINEPNLDLDEYEYDELIKEWGGLAISKRLAKKMKWNLSVNSDDNWTTFKILINR